MSFHLGRARTIVPVVAALLAAPVALAQDATIGDLTIAHAWSPPLLAGRTEGAVYFTIRNAGSGDERLVAAASPVAARAELHAHVMSGDVMRMEKVDGLTVPAGGELPFAPGGYHVMLFGVTASPTLGETFPLTLTFEEAGKVEVSVRVESLADNLTPTADHSGHHQEHGDH